MGILLTLFKFRDVGYIAIIAGLFIWTQGLRLEISGTSLKISNARIEAQERADALANELIIEQAKAMAINTETRIIHVEKIKRVKDSGAAGDAERNRLGTIGVSDILRGRTPKSE